MWSRYCRDTGRNGALAAHLHRQTGPLIVTAAGALFLLSLLYRRADQRHVGSGLTYETLSLVIVSDAVWKWIYRLGGPGLILLGIFDNTPFVSAPPGSVDAFVILLSGNRHEWWAYYAFMATVGEVLGAI